MTEKPRKPKKVQVIVVEEDAPIIPQLVPVTIRWVESDRAYRATLYLTCVNMSISVLMLILDLPPKHILLGVLFSAVGHTAVLGLIRFGRKKELEEMKRKLDIDSDP